MRIDDLLYRQKDNSKISHIHGTQKITYEE